ncbi:hypothetical protein [Gimesia fumaroli]|nr:hypothetical protein [Gimesia fumaroli]
MMKTRGSGPLPEKIQDNARFQNKASWAAEEEVLDHTLIADLSNEQIHQMTREELVRVILAAKLDFLDLGGQHRVSCFDRVILERLAYLARFCCQNQMSRTFKSGKEGHACSNTKKNE